MALYTSNGQILGYNGIRNGETCPCGGVPCTCPCGGVWPPASWPCGGLNETYVMSNNLVSVFDGTLVTHFYKWYDWMQGDNEIIEYRLTGTTILTAVQPYDFTCYWAAPYGENCQYRKFTHAWTLIQDWTNTQNEPWIHLSPDTPCGWYGISSGGMQVYAWKLTGNTPIGVYSREEFNPPEQKTGFILS